jgi:hypothetical protein
MMQLGTDLLNLGHMHSWQILDVKQSQDVRSAKRTPLNKALNCLSLLFWRGISKCIELTRQHDLKREQHRNSNLVDDPVERMIGVITEINWIGGVKGCQNIVISEKRMKSLLQRFRTGRPNARDQKSYV